VSEPFTVSVYGKGCCGDHDVHSWEEAVREAASSMMNLTNRVAKVVSLHKANLVELIGTLDSKVKFVADEGGEWWQRQGVRINTEVGPVRVITTKDIPRMAAFVASQDDIDEYVESMKWIRATKEAR
jgi:hypothetical protein